MNIAIFAVANAVAARVNRFVALLLAPALASRPASLLDAQRSIPWNGAAPLLHVSSVTELKPRSRAGGASHAVQRAGWLARVWQALLRRDPATAALDMSDAFAALEYA